MAQKNSPAANSDGFDEDRIDRERVDRVIERLALRRDAALGDYAEFFGDRHDLAKVWKFDLSHGVALSTDRRGALTSWSGRPIPSLELRLTRFWLRGKAAG